MATDDALTSARFPIVGLGASAGGLTALRQFLSATPSDTGFAFVVITHQGAERPGKLPELLQAHCALSVVAVSTPSTVEPDRVYVAAPGCVLGMSHGRLLPMSDDTHHPIDFFFRSLAADRGAQAVAVVLSGSGTDGTDGIRAVKAASGLVVAQEGTSAEFSGMPLSAVGTEAVDFVAPADALPALIVDHFAEGHPASSVDEPEIHRILLLLRTRSGRDFLGYKKPTIRRCIERRMTIRRTRSLADYAGYVESNPRELDVLLDSFLIGVTAFFRDDAAFESLRERAIAPMIARRAFDATLRIWVAGCATGEEAYSIAILLHEEMERQQRPMNVQIFATDLHPGAIEYARAGLYPLTVATDLGPRRTAAYFNVEGGSLRVRRTIREMVVFAVQDILEDPPFTKLDLLCCRNVLIYLGPELQKRIVPFLRYALEPDGLLFLGSAESTSAAPNLFVEVDGRWKIFGVAPTTSAGRRSGWPAADRRIEDALAPQSPCVVERALLELLAPAAVVVNDRGVPLHIHGPIGRFLEPARGPQRGADVFAMARRGLTPFLFAGMRDALPEAPVLYNDVAVHSDGEVTVVDLRVQKLSEPESLKGVYVISFEAPRVPVRSIGPPRVVPALDDHPDVDADVGRLELALEHSRAMHRDMVQDAEEVGAELHSTNDKLLSTNEALQGANEELETSKEEMRSLNEELQTVNAELHSKVEELSAINDDMKNVLSGTDIATVFLDRMLRIRRFTEQATRVFRLIDSDVGRPLEDLVHHLRYAPLLDDIRDVLETLSTKELEVQSSDERWLLMRILPYRTVDNVIDGVALAFIDITAVKQAQQRERRIVDVLTGSPTTFFGQDRDLHYLWATDAVFGVPVDAIIGHCDEDVLDADGAARLSAIKRQVLDDRATLRAEVEAGPVGTTARFDVFVSPTVGVDGTIEGIRGIITELTTTGGA